MQITTLLTHMAASQSKRLDWKGVTLVEVMISLVILLLVSLALMQTALVSIDANMNNVLRDEAVNIAEQRMDEARSLPFDFPSDPSNSLKSLVDDDATHATLPTPNDCPSTFTLGTRVQRNFRNIIAKDFCTNRDVTDLGDARRVDIRVIWKWKGEDFSHSISTVIRRPS